MIGSQKGMDLIIPTFQAFPISLVDLMKILISSGFFPQLVENIYL